MRLRQPEQSRLAQTVEQLVEPCNDVVRTGCVCYRCRCFRTCTGGAGRTCRAGGANCARFTRRACRTGWANCARFTCGAGRAGWADCACFTCGAGRAGGADCAEACGNAFGQLYYAENDIGRRYLRWRGLDDGDAATFGLGFTRDPKEIMPEFSVYEPKAFGFITIPFWNKDFSTANYCMVRTVCRPGDARNKEWRPRGLASPLWCEWLLSVAAEQVYVTEGLIDAMALAILKVDHVENRLGDNHAVTGTKAARHILREVETSLEDNHCVGTSLLRLGEPACHELRIGDRALTHFRIVIAVRLELGFDLIFIGDLVKLTEEVARCELCESVRNRSLFGVSAG